MEENILKTLKFFIEDFLMNYNFDTNTEEFRTEIKKGLDKICEFFLNGKLIYDYKNICDDSNNTKYVTDLRMGVTDTYVTVNKDGETVVLQTTILKKNIVDGRFNKEFN